MSAITRRDRGLFPELFELLEMPFPGTRPAIKFEDYVREGRYVLRAELPGIDPDKDAEITLANGILTVHAIRQHEEKEAHRSEFYYGSFTRSITLPSNADENDVKATYDQGILQISVKLADKKQPGTRIMIEKS